MNQAFGLFLYYLKILIRIYNRQPENSVTWVGSLMERTCNMLDETKSHVALHRCLGVNQE